VDEVIVFHALSSAEILQIVDLMLDRVNTQVKAQGMELEVSDAAKQLLATEGYDPTMGARPLRRAVQKLIEDPLAEAMLAGSFTHGDVICADVENGKISFIKRMAPDTLPPLEEAAALISGE
jgi:ATP-dependent Clp protease ATP-binding subunit ClpC